MRISAILASLALTPCLLSAEWQPLSFKGAAKISRLAIAQSDRTIRYAAIARGGVYRSEDEGSHWLPLHGNLSIGDRMRLCDHVRSLDVDPRDADRVVIACGDDPSCPGGIVVTRDGGRTFHRTLVAHFHGSGSRSKLGNVIARNPDNPDELVVASDMDGIFASSDGGEHWEPRGLDDAFFCCVAYDKNVGDRVYACAPAVGSCVSDDLPSSPIGQRKSGFFVSENGGLSWQTLSTDVVPCEIAQVAGAKFLVSIIGERRVMMSEDGGKTWQPFERGLPSGDFSIGGLTAVEGGYRLVMNGGTVWQAASDADAVWREVGKDTPALLTGFGALLPVSLAIDPKSRNTVFYGDADRGLFVSHDGGKSFNSLPNGCRKAAFSNQTKDLVLWLNDKNEIWRSRDGGKSMERTSEIGLPADAAFSEIVSHPQHAAFCVSSPYGLFVSADDGDTWHQRGKGLPNGREYSVTFSIDSAAVAVDRTGEVWWLDGVSSTWKPSTSPFAIQPTISAVADPDVPSRFLLSSSDGLCESTDGGRTFHRFGPLSGLIHSLAFDQNRRGLIYACGSDELYVSHDGGRHFGVLDGALALPTGRSRRIVADRGRLYFLTSETGVWEWREGK